MSKAEIDIISISSARQELSVVLTGGELEVFLPFSVNLEGTTYRLINGFNKLSGDFIRQSDTYPFRRLNLLPGRSEDAVEPTTTYKRLNDGTIDFFLKDFWQLAQLYTEGKVKARGKEKWWVPGVSWVDKNLAQKYPLESVSLYTQSESFKKTAKLWLWLVSYGVVKQAALTHLSKKEALGKKILDEESTRIMLPVLLVLAGHAGGTDPWRLAGTASAAAFSLVVLKFREDLEKKLRIVEGKLLEEIGQKPLIELS